MNITRPTLRTRLRLAWIALFSHDRDAIAVAAEAWRWPPAAEKLRQEIWTILEPECVDEKGIRRAEACLRTLEDAMGDDEPDLYSLRFAIEGEIPIDSTCYDVMGGDRKIDMSLIQTCVDERFEWKTLSRITLENIHACLLDSSFNPSFDEWVKAWGAKIVDSGDTLSLIKTLMRDSCKTLLSSQEES